MTLSQIQAARDPFLLPADVAQVLRCDPQYIRDTARANPGALGFPVTVIGNRVKIPRVPFLRYIGEESMT